MAKSKDKNTNKDDGGDPPKFFTFGSDDQPDRLEKLFQRPPLAARTKPPKDFLHAQTHRKIYMRSDDAPKISVNRVEENGIKNIHCATIATEDASALHLPGRTALRESPAKLLDETDPKASFGANRPEWMPASYYPRPLPDLGRAPGMRSIRGRSTRPLYVFGADDRLAYMDSTWPWGLVGKVYTSSGWTGSAALIGPRLIATAGHVVPWGGGSWWMRFVPAHYNGVSLHGAGVESYVSDARGFDTNGSVTGYDWAVCRLYEPLGNWLGYFGYNGYSSSWEDDPYWTVLGYPGAVASGQRPSYQSSVSSFDTDGDSNGGLEIETKADMTPGNSGGPMFGWWNGDPRLVGVVSGQEEDWSPGFWPWDWGDTERGNVVAGGSGFTNLMAWGRTNWPL
jgi:V8-like Glu-specific endopeptidase